MKFPLLVSSTEKSTSRWPLNDRAFLSKKKLLLKQSCGGCVLVHLLLSLPHQLHVNPLTRFMEIPKEKICSLSYITMHLCLLMTHKNTILAKSFGVGFGYGDKIKTPDQLLTPRLLPLTGCSGKRMKYLLKGQHCRRAMETALTIYAENKRSRFSLALSPNGSRYYSSNRTVTI